MISGTARWYTIGNHLVTAVKAGVTSSLNRSGQVPGEIAWDSCDCGMLAVTTTRVYYAEIFPDETEGPVGASCQAPYEVGEYLVAVIRCVPTAEGQKLAPTDTELDTAAGLILQDLAETQQALAALLCQLKEDDHISDYLIMPAESQGPSGACGGFQSRVLISLDRS